MSVNRSPIPQVRGISRRRLLGYIGVGLVSSLMTPLPLDAFAASTQTSPQNLEKFMLVSRALTGKRQLNGQIGQRIYQILLGKIGGFDQKLALLQLLPAGEPAQWPPLQQQIARQILQGWYIGVIGEGADAAVISFENALMFDAVSDVLVIRSYCPNRPGYWAAKPDVAL
ncbi:sugar dehydrogenase complex small subunit [Yersinia bercovieri]|uniref:sugar dehydrogenase complex small subunit n=1 Tax=Yersinia bercovieri TaxID=634 RepID=UPI0005E4C290|nr:sugar dehydrogenase complex small subunit [Yersinia bercovieri]MDN0104862.1 sugar dehydrogenase complex small subunit [Yersinia bercovieri]CFQ30979.1 2-keto-D-gluconate dehydrogenase%2Cmembrane-bound%2C gamma subunit [Yersinia bercovieri]CNI25139.1 2-keto-D-gluconate dehydrogenase%2Cmembrane-bound%2C gamma subunit [Yersinia bercovieri]